MEHVQIHLICKNFTVHISKLNIVFLLLWTAKHIRYVIILWEPLCASHVFFILIQLEFHSHQLIVNNYPCITESTDTIFSILNMSILNILVHLEKHGNLLALD